MEETIDLREYFFILKKKLWIIVTSALVCGLISGLVSFFALTPIYQANTSLIVNKEVGNKVTEMTTTDDLNYVQKLAITYGEIIKSRKVLDDVIKNLDLDESYGQLSGKISVSTVSDTQIIKVSVQDTNKSNAAKIANEIPKVFAKEAIRIADANGVEVIDKAQTPVNPVSPNKKMNILIAGVLGVMIGLFIIFIIEFLNTKIKTPQDIEKELGLPLLGVVPEEL